MIPIITLFMYLSVIMAADSGPADVTLQKLEKCSKDTMGSRLIINMKKINTTHVGFNLHLRLPFPYDHKVAMNATISKWENGAWKPKIFEIYDPNFCIFLDKYLPRLVNDMRKIWKVSMCPLPQGVYNATNYAVDTNIGMPLTYGDYKMTAYLLRDTKRFACLRAFVKVVTKTKQSG